MVAAEVAQAVPRGRRLDALGDDAQAEALGERRRPPRRSRRRGRPRPCRRTKPWSIFSSSTGRCLRLRERRVAGAEVVDREPRRRGPRSRASTPIVRSGSAMTAFSVTSTQSRSGGDAVARAAARATVAGKRGVERGSRLRRSRRPARRAGRRASRGAACATPASTRAVNGRIRPGLLDASAGSRRASAAPRVGCCQRTSASTPRGRPVAMSTWGWKCSSSSPRGDARRAARRGATRRSRLCSSRSAR